TSGSRPSGSPASTWSSTTSWASGSSLVTTSTATRGASSATRATDADGGAGRTGHRAPLGGNVARVTWQPAFLVSRKDETAEAVTLAFGLPEWPGHLPG